MTSIVEIDHVFKMYGAQAALSDITLQIQSGEIFALLGPNGAGKTTLLRILTGILLPDSGTVRILGASSMGEVRHQVGYLPEERGLYRRQPIGDILAYLGELKGLSAKQARERVRIVLEQVGMLAHVASTPEALSKGMAQRIQIAAALIHDPPFLILDEPFSGLDPVSSRQLQEIVTNEKQRGRTILLSTHQMDTVERLCDRLLMLHRGKTVLSGIVSEVRACFGEGVLRIEHGTERLPGPLPPGVRIRDASLPFVTELLPPNGLAPREILSALLTQGVDIRAFAPVIPSLEEIFVRIVGEKG
ncbi:MAG: ATP-binding cassette domain-containing protein [Cytophagales bacterium]|nr:ATP-binding cassette domain-containing protein [Armatimonadota bacterium]